MLGSINSLRKSLTVLVGNSGKYVINSSWLALERMFRMASALVVGIWVARYLGPEKFGLLNYSQSLVLLVGAIATLGLDTIVTRSLVVDPDKRNEILGTAFLLRVGGWLLSLIFLIGIVNSLGIDWYTQTIIYTISISVLLQSFNVIDLHFQSIVSSKYVVFANFLASFISSLFKVYLVMIAASLEFFAFAAVIDQVLIAAGLSYYFHNQGESILKWTFNRSLVGRFLRASWPLILSGISISIGMRIDQVMIKSMIDDEHVGWYAVGVKLAEVFNFIPMVIGQTIFPKVIGMDLGVSRDKLVLMLRYIFYGLVVLGAFVNITGGLTVSFLYGVEYEASTAVLSILIWTIPFTFLNIITNMLLIKVGDSASVLKRQAALTIVNICLNLLLIPVFGIIGAAFATLSAEAFILMVDFIRSRHKWIWKLRLQAVLFLPASKDDGYR